MSPEQAKSRSLDGKCDQYALGCILYQLLTGKPPFYADSPIETIFLRLVQAPVPPRQVSPGRGISEQLEAITMRCLALLPEQRFASMDALADALADEEESLSIEQGRRRSSSSLRGDRLSSPSLAGHALPGKGGLRARLGGLSRRGQVLLGASALVLVLAGFALLLRGRHDTLSVEALRALDRRAVAVLVQTVGSATAEGENKTRALAGLAETYDVRLRSTIEAALGSSSEEVQAQAAATLGTLGATASATRLADVYLTAKAPRVRLAAARSLDQLGDARGTRYLREALTTGEEETRLRAAFLLCERADAPALSYLQGLVDAGTLPPQLLLNGLSCLARSGNEPAQQRLASLLAGGSAKDLQLGAAARLVQLGDARGRNLLQELAGHGGPQQLLAARMLATTQEPAIAAVFRSVHESSDASADALLLSLEGLGLCGQLSDLPLLEPRLADGTPERLRVAAASAIVQIVHRDSSLLTTTTADWTRAALDDPNWTIRQGAATVLGDSQASDALSMLARVMKDHEAQVRKSGARALGRRPERDALRVLQTALADSEVDVRREALRSLNKIGRSLAGADRSAVLTTVGAWLRPMLQTGSRPEQVLVRGVLLQLGDGAQAAQLRAAAAGAPEDVRVLVAEQLEPAPQELGAFLSDSSLLVRLIAARLFALRGDHRGMSVLSEGLSQGGALAQMAIGAIGRLGGKVQLVREAEALLNRGSLEERLAVVQAWATLPPEQALPLLGRAARNGEPSVRMQVVEALSDLPAGPSGPGSPDWLAVLRLLSRDGDAAVRVRAATVLVRALQPVAELRPARSASDQSGGSSSAKDSVTQSAQGPVPAPSATTGAQPEPPSLPPPQEGRGSLQLTSPHPVLYQIDQRLWQRTDGRPVALDAGTHKVSTLSGTSTVVVVANQTASLALEVSPAEEAERRGQEALAAQDFRKAQKFFDKARAACGKAAGHLPGCALLGIDLAFRLGQVYEAQSRWAEAMAAYQTAAQLAPQVRGQKENRTLAQAGIARLESRLGRVVMSKNLHGSCKEQTVWMPTGTHTLVVGGSSKTIKVTAGQTVQVGSCE